MQSKTKQAVFWIMAAPKGTRRTQEEAAEKFGITQTAVSRGMGRYVHADLRPDGRRRQKRGA